MAASTSILRFLGHSTVLLDLDGVRVLTDPVLVDRLGPLHRHAGEVREDDVAVDAVLVSHAHHDHLHLPSLERLRGRPKIVVPAGLATLVEARGHDVIEMRAGDRVSLGALAVEAVPARHHGGRHPLGSLGIALGYRLAASVRVYFAGDTDLFPEMSDLSGNVDVALLPVWGWGPRLGVGHLDPLRAAEAVCRIRPRVAVPIHWGTFYPYALARIWPRALARPPHDFAREVERVAPQTEVKILAPGETLRLT